MRAGFNFYPALPQDVADNRELLATGFKLPMPRDPQPMSLAEHSRVELE